MIKAINTKVLISMAVVLAAAAIIIGGTFAFFSDTEVSNENNFTAGAIDLKIDSTCHYNGLVCSGDVWTLPDDVTAPDYPEVGSPCECTWIEDDIYGKPIFNFSDIKPGDFGESTLSFHLTSNPAWACMYVNNVVDSDNGCNDPELAAEPNCGPDDENGGELDNALLLTVWIDDGDGEGQGGIACDNVRNGTEELLGDEDMPLSNFMDQVSNSYVLPISTPNSWLMQKPIKEGNHCIGIAWRVDSTTGNAVQTDQLGGDLTFYVEQSRNNSGFVCPTGVPTEPAPTDVE